MYLVLNHGGMSLHKTNTHKTFESFVFTSSENLKSILLDLLILHKTVKHFVFTTLINFFTLSGLVLTLTLTPPL